MKIENNGSTPITPKRTDSVQSTTRRDLNQTSRTSQAAGKDRAEVTENARLLAKARTAMDSLDEVESERLELLKQQIANGNYEIPVEELAKRLLAKNNLINNSGV